MKKERLEEIIGYLEKDPQIVYNPYPEYAPEVYELLDSLGVERNYMLEYEKIINKQICEMTLHDLRTMFTFIRRSERFSIGSIAEYIKNKNLLKLAKRELELIDTDLI